MKLLTATVNDIIDRRPCYPAERMRELYRGRECWTALQIIREIGKAFDIPDADLLWTVLHHQFIDERNLRLLACQFAERALLRERAAGREPDSRSWKAIEVSRLFADGKATEKERSAAAAAAAAAARWSAAAAAAARWSAAAAERKWQVQVVVKMLTALEAA